jgi:hypothetical protein
MRLKTSSFLIQQEIAHYHLFHAIRGQVKRDSLAAV